MIFNPNEFDLLELEIDDDSAKELDLLSIKESNENESVVKEVRQT